MDNLYRYGYLVTCQAPRSNRVDDNNFAFASTSPIVCRLFLYTGAQTQRALSHNTGLFFHLPLLPPTAILGNLGHESRKDQKQSIPKSSQTVTTLTPSFKRVINLNLVIQVTMITSI